jgi:hypothetical protein
MPPSSLSSPRGNQLFNRGKGEAMADGFVGILNLAKEVSDSIPFVGSAIPPLIFIIETCQVGCLRVCTTRLFDGLTLSSNLG